MKVMKFESKRNFETFRRAASHKFPRHRHLPCHVQVTSEISDTRDANFGPWLTFGYLSKRRSLSRDIPVGEVDSENFFHERIHFLWFLATMYILMS